MEGSTWIWPVIGGVVGLIVLVLFLMAIYKVAEPNKALVVTGFGCKEPKVRVSGGAFVIPILQRARFFPLDIMTITEAGDEVRTNRAVPIVIKWTAQVAVQTDDRTKLVKTIRLFIDRGASGIQESVKYTIQANVRETIAGMTPEAVLTDKKEFVSNIVNATQPDLDTLGLKLSTLNINDVCDSIGYYDNMAAEQIQEKRREAAAAEADADRDIREKTAAANQQAKEKELAADLAIAENQRNNDVKKAQFKVETETADANAEIAKELQTQIRQAELNEKTGAANIIAKEQENLVALKQNTVAQTEADRLVIETKGQADADAKKLEIDTGAAAKAVEIEADGKAKAAQRTAEGQAEAVKRKAAGDAEAVKLEAVAEQDRITRTGTAEADVVKAKGLADAEAIKAQGLAQAETTKAQGLAEAEAQHKMAEALAANEGVNFRIEELQIQANAQVQIATNYATVMSHLGTNAKFVHIGGGDASGNAAGKTGNILLDTIGGIPSTLFKADVTSDALNDSTAPGDLSSIINAFRKQNPELAGMFGLDSTAKAEETPAQTPADGSEK